MTPGLSPIISSCDRWAMIKIPSQFHVFHLDHAGFRTRSYTSHERDKKEESRMSADPWAKRMCFIDAHLRILCSNSVDVVVVRLSRVKVAQVSHGCLGFRKSCGQRTNTLTRMKCCRQSNEFLVFNRCSKAFACRRAPRTCHIVYTWSNFVDHTSSFLIRL